jgi:uncharacterized OsmC-like protein
MAQTTVSIRTMHGATAAAGWSNGRSIVVDRPESAGGLGIGFSGGELLLLAIGGCYCNDLFREAQKAGVPVNSVHIDVSCNWDGDPVRARDVKFCVRVESPAPEGEIADLIRHTDRVAEIPNSLRYGTQVELESFEVI